MVIQCLETYHVPGFLLRSDLSCMMKEIHSALFNVFDMIYHSPYHPSFVFHTKITRGLCIHTWNKYDRFCRSTEHYLYFVEIRDYALTLSFG